MNSQTDGNLALNNFGNVKTHGSGILHDFLGNEEYKSEEMDTNDEAWISLREFNFNRGPNLIN